MKNKFIDAIEKYYGKYGNETIKKSVIAFVQLNWEESEIDKLLYDTFKNFSNQFGKQPDIHFFNSLWEKKHLITDPATLAEKEWGGLVHHYSGSPILCTDNFTQQTIEAMGGWDEFCEAKARDPYWTHKDFVERYIRYSKINVQTKPKVLKGYNEKYYNKIIDYNKIKVIGDESKALVMIENIKKEVTEQIEYKASGSDDPQSIGEILKITKE